MTLKYLVTGGRSAIGSAVINEALSKGVKVFATSSARDFVLSQGQASSKVIWLHWDPADTSSAMSCATELSKYVSSLDSVALCAGMPHGGLLLHAPMKKLEEVFRFNVFSQVELIQQVWKLLRRSNETRSVVFVSSAVSNHPMKGYGVYGSSKTAVEYIMQVLSLELETFGIRLNSVLPGLTESPMMHSMDEKAQKEFLHRVSAKRVALPSEIAKLITFLMGPESSYINGQNINIDGGLQ